MSNSDAPDCLAVVDETRLNEVLQQEVLCKKSDKV